MEFCIGDRVVAIRHYGRVEKGDTGTFVHKETIEPEYGVRWDKEDPNMHNCQGHCESKHGWYVPERYLRHEDVPDYGDLPHADTVEATCLLFGL